MHDADATNGRSVQQCGSTQRCWRSRMRINGPRHFGFLAVLIGPIIGYISLADGLSRAPTLDRPPVPSAGDTFTYRWRGEIVAMTYLGRDGDLYCYSAKVSVARQSTVCHTSEDNTGSAHRQLGAGNLYSLPPDAFLSPVHREAVGAFIQCPTRIWELSG
jgi:hypothetical protein